MSTVRVLFAAPAARCALVDGRVGVVEMVLSQGTYVRLHRDWLVFAEPSVPFGPLSLAAEGLAVMQLVPGLPVRVSAGEVLLGEHAISIDRMRERRLPPLVRAQVAPSQAVTAAAEAALALLPAAPAGLGPGIAALTAGRPRDGAHQLAGLGEGLTPAGDDVLTGYAAWIGAPALLSSLAAQRSSPLGLAYIRCAEQGELAEAGARMYTAIRSGSLESVRAAVPGVLKWGATSGAALTWGIAAAAKACPICDSKRIDMRQLPIGARER